jgi:predicted DNA-binding protein with PD1-like motif
MRRVYSVPELGHTIDMRWRELSSGSAGRAYVLVFDIGDEAVSGIEGFAGRNDVRGARFTAIGAFERAVVGYFDWNRKDYARIPIDEQVEVLTMAGDIALADGAPAVHAHVVLGRSDATTRGGHLLEGIVRPTLEVMLEESPSTLRKRHDAETGLALIDPQR